MRRRLLRIGWACLLLAALVPVLPIAEAHSYHLQVANEVLAGPEEVNANRWVAQSFVAPSDSTAQSGQVRSMRR